MFPPKLVYACKKTSNIIFQQNSSNLENFLKYGFLILCKNNLFRGNGILIRIHFNFFIAFTLLHTLNPPHSSKKTRFGFTQGTSKSCVFQTSTPPPYMDLFYPPNFWHHQARVNKKILYNGLFCRFWETVSSSYSLAGIPLNCVSIQIHFRKQIFCSLVLPNTISSFHK